MTETYIAILSGLILMIEYNNNKNKMYAKRKKR